MANGDQQTQVWNPDGKLGMIPASELQMALGAGYSRRQDMVEVLHPKTGKTGLIPASERDDARAQGFAPSPRQLAFDKQTPEQAGQGMQYQWYPGAMTPGGTALAPGGKPVSIPGGAEESVLARGAGPGAAGMAALGIPGQFIRAPIATTLSLAGGALGQEYAKRAGQKLGLSPGWQKGVEIGGGALGAFAGGFSPNILEGATEVGSSALNQIKKLFRIDPERLEEAGKYFPAKEGIEQAARQAEASSRAVGHANYQNMGIDAAPGEVTPAANLAKQGVEAIQAAGQSASKPLQTLAESKSMTFKEMQDLRSAINQTMGTLRGPAYTATKSSVDALSDIMKSVAEREGKASEFAAAEAYWKQHAADFWNKGAPLKPLTGALPDTSAKALNKFLSSVNNSRVLDALDRRGVQTAGVKDLLENKTVQAVKDAVTLTNLGQPALNRQAVQASRQAAVKYGGRAVAGATGVGTLAELIRWLSTRPQSKRQGP